MANKKLGIVTVLYKSAPVLPDFYKSLQNQTYQDFILYVIDNNSPDDSLAVATALTERASFDCVVIAEKENWGVAKGNNIGITRALADGCDYVLLANKDTEFTPDTLHTLIDSMERNNADMITPKIDIFGKQLVWYGGGGFGFFCVTYHRGEWKKDSKKYHKPGFVDYAPTCFMIIKKDVFEKVGMMDERYFVYYDDTDFIWRAVKGLGYKVYYESSALIQHKVGSSSKSASATFGLHYFHRNMAFFMNRYYDSAMRRIPVYAYYTYLHLKRKLRHPSMPGFITFFKYFREGQKMYQDMK